MGTTVKEITVGKLQPKRSYGLYQKLLFSLFKKMTVGQLSVYLPDGQRKIFGNGLADYCATIRVYNNDFFRKCILFGDIGFGESYVDGDWETANIQDVIEWMLANIEHHPTLMDNSPRRVPVNLLRVFNTFYYRIRPNTVKGSSKNIAAHYDLSNEMFKLILDPSMTYSSAIFKDPKKTLAEAQAQKYENLCQKLCLKATDHVLEIGSGWGGCAIYIAKNFGARVTTVTISKEQYAFAQKRIEEEGLSHRIDIRLCDYRHIQDKYDKIISIEMIEAVGHKYYPVFFKQCHNLLKKDGLLGLQAILCPDHRYESFRKNSDWIQKHVFPGSLLPSYAMIQKMVNKTGTLNLHHYEDITDSYAKTLLVWQDNFNVNLKSVRELGFGNEFIRKWNYYFSYCAGAFKMHNIKSAQMIFTRPNNSNLIDRSV